MSYASIVGDDSHRQSKKFKQRLKYRLDLGHSYEEALRLATIKEIAGQTSLRLIQNPIDSTQPISMNIVDKTLLRVDDSSSDEIRPLEARFEEVRNSSEPQTSRPEGNSHSPSQDEIRLIVEKLKLTGHMTEIPTGTNFVSSAETVSSSTFLQTSPDRPKLETAVSSDPGPSRVPYWIVSTLACCWLVYSMTSSLPGHWFWNLLIAVAFEFTPMLLLGARIDRKYQKTVFWGAIGIFLVGLGLYLAPSIQTLVNELCFDTLFCLKKVTFL